LSDSTVVSTSTGLTVTIDTTSPHRLLSELHFKLWLR
jgi:hypothetical protein